MHETLSTLSAWLTLHPQWIAITLGLTAFIESLAMIGVIIPGVAVLYGVSALAGSLHVSLGACLAAAALGAFAGDVLSFGLGRYAHAPMRRRWPFRQHPQWIDRGERFLDRYGIPSIVIGRFVGPIRPVLPFVAGMLAMAPTRFIPINGLSALLWSLAYVLPGYLFGRLAEDGLDAPQNSPWLNLLLLLIIGGGLLTLWLIHHGMAPGSNRYRQLTRHRWWPSLRSPLNGELPLTSMTLLLVSGTTFTLLALVVALGNPLAPLDQAFASLFRLSRAPLYDPLAVLITAFGDSANLLSLSLIVATALWCKGDRAGALHWVGAMLLLALLNLLFKEGLATPRPQQLIDPFSTFSYSFPSAHSANSTLFFALGASFVAQQLDYRQRRWVYAAAALPIAAICLSRLYLGVHWLTDVIGGVSLALTVCAATRVSYSRYQQRHRFQRRDLLPLAAGLLWIVLYLSWRFGPALASYRPLPV